MIDSVGTLARDLVVEVDPELEAYLPGQADRSAFDLESAIIEAGGAIDPITVWEATLIDGHRRLEICRKHGLPLLGGVRHMEFPSRREVKHWMDVYQTTRRNLSGPQWAVVVARMDKYLLEEKLAGRFKGSVVRELQKQTGLSASTAYRAKTHGEALQSIAEPIRARILSGELKLSVSAAIEMGAMPEREQKAIVIAFERGDHASLTEAVLGDGETQDNASFTPPNGEKSVTVNRHSGGVATPEPEPEPEPPFVSRLVPEDFEDYQPDDIDYGDLPGHKNGHTATLTKAPVISMGAARDAALKQLGLLSKALDQLNEASPDAARISNMRSNISNIRNSLLAWAKGAA